MRGHVLMVLAAVAGLSACSNSNDPTPTPTSVTYTASLAGASERPNPVTTSATGSFTATISTNNVLSYTVTFTGLTSNSNNAHIHGPITPGSNAAASVLVNFNAPTSGRSITFGATEGTGQGQVDLTQNVTATVSGDSLKKLFDAGLLYVNVHSVNNPGGEILGIVTKQP